MTTPYGAWTVQGIQSGLPGGGGSILGPFIIPFADCQNTTTYTFSGAGGPITFDIPGGADDPNAGTPTGLWIIPSGGGAAVSLGLAIGGGSSFAISFTYPTFIAFDSTHLEATFTLTAGGPVEITLQYV